MSSHERKINPARTISADARSAFKTFFNMNGITKPENNYIYSLAEASAFGRYILDMKWQT